MCIRDRHIVKNKSVEIKLTTNRCLLFFSWMGEGKNSHRALASGARCARSTRSGRSARKAVWFCMIFVWFQGKPKTIKCILAASWVMLVPSWADLGPSWHRSWLILRLSWLILSLSWRILEAKSPKNIKTVKNPRFLLLFWRCLAREFGV